MPSSEPKYFHGFKGSVRKNMKGGHCDLKVQRSEEKINENFGNYFLKIKANNKCVTVLTCACNGLRC